MNNLLSATSLYGTNHIIFLCISLIAITSFYLIMKNKDLTVWLKVMLYLGILSELIKVVSYTIMNEGTYNGYLPKTDLPFHLCSIQIIFILILNISKNEKLNRFILSFMLPTCLVGGIMALLLPTSSSRSVLIISCQYFLYHSMLIAFSIYLFTSKNIKWEFEDYKNSLKFLLIMAFFAIYINSMCYDVVEYTVEDGKKIVEYVSRVNFMYIVDPPAENLPILNKNDGWLAYIIRYALVAVSVITLCYIKPIIIYIKQKLSKQTISNPQD